MGPNGAVLQAHGRLEGQGSWRVLFLQMVLDSRCVGGGPSRRKRAETAHHPGSGRARAALGKHRALGVPLDQGRRTRNGMAPGTLKSGKAWTTTTRELVKLGRLERLLTHTLCIFPLH